MTGPANAPEPTPWYERNSVLALVGIIVAIALALLNPFLDRTWPERLEAWPWFRPVLWTLCLSAVAVLAFAISNRRRRRATVGPDPANPDRQVRGLLARLRNGDAFQRREAAIALGRLGDSARVGLPEMVVALNDVDPHVRENVAQALETIGPPAVRVLIVALRHAKGRGFVDTPMSPRPVPALWDVMGEADVRELLVQVGPSAIPALTEALERGPSDLRPLVAAALLRVDRATGQG